MHYTALMNAAKLDAGHHRDCSGRADLNAKDEEGQTVFLKAASGHLSVRAARPAPISPKDKKATRRWRSPGRREDVVVLKLPGETSPPRRSSSPKQGRKRPPIPNYTFNHAER
jgi:hypothetical protein